jgi:hypothetical protein
VRNITKVINPTGQLPPPVNIPRIRQSNRPVSGGRFMQLQQIRVQTEFACADEIRAPAGRFLSPVTR